MIRHAAISLWTALTETSIGSPIKKQYLQIEIFIGRAATDDGFDTVMHHSLANRRISGDATSIGRPQPSKSTAFQQFRPADVNELKPRNLSC